MANIAERILENTNVTQTDLGKSKITTGNAYRITLSHNGRKASFVFNDNHLNESSKTDFIYCLMQDANGYRYAESIHRFMREFGYDDYRQANAIYKAVGKQAERWDRLYNLEEQEALEGFFENY